jgi:uncharacterized protein YhfF
VKHTFAVGDRVAAASVTFPATGVVLEAYEEGDVDLYLVEWQSNRHRASYKEQIEGIHLRPAAR